MSGTNQPTSTHSVVSENGRTYYYINVQPQNPSVLDSDRSSQEVNPPEQPDPNPLEKHQLVDKSGPLCYYGENMVVKNARDMFNNVDILADGRYFCCVCNRPYKTHATLTAHLRGSHLRQESPCREPGCNHVSFTEIERKRHQKIHDKRKYSKYSREEFREQQNMDEVAQIAFPSENVLREQIIRNSRHVHGTVSNVNKRGKLRYLCLQCKNTFPNAYHATRHMETHNESLKQCFYCGEVKNGTMDLHIHYLRCHKNEGVRTITCKACERAFTTTTLFRNHANQKECEIACQNLLVRQDIYYGELPEGTTIDSLTINRMNFFRKQQKQRSAEDAFLESRMDTAETGTEMGGVETVMRRESSSDRECKDLDYSDEIFNGANLLIQTEFGLKTLAEFKTSRVTKRTSPADHQLDIKRERAASQNSNNNNSGYFPQYDPPAPLQQSEKQQKNDVCPMDYVFPPPVYGYDPLIGRYPDFQPMQQLQYAYGFRANNTYYGEPSRSQVLDQEIKQERPEEAPDAQNDDIFASDGQDVVFEELDKLDFVMPTNNQDDDSVEDLEEMFNF